MYSIRIRLKIATKHTLIHRQSSHSASENFLDVMQESPTATFLALGNKARGMLK